MLETVESIRAKQNYKPMKNHNYLKRVLEALLDEPGSYQNAPPQKPPKEVVRRDEEAERKANEAAYIRQMASLGFRVLPNGRVVQSSEEEQ